MGEINFNKIAAQVMTVADVAEYLRLSQAKVYRLARTGKFPALRVGKSWRFRKDLIDDWFLKGVQSSQGLAGK